MPFRSPRSIQDHSLVHCDRTPSKLRSYFSLSRPILPSPAAAMLKHFSPLGCYAFLLLFLLAANTIPARGGETVSQPPEAAKSVTFDSPEATSPSGTDAFLLQPGFRVERLFSVPKDTFGSW